MTRFIRLIALAVFWIMFVLLLLLPFVAARAHDSWISRQGLRNGAGEWCCGEGDCPALNYTPRITAGGYLLENGEVVPFQEASSVEDHGVPCS